MYAVARPPNVAGVQSRAAARPPGRVGSRNMDCGIAGKGSKESVPETPTARRLCTTSPTFMGYGLSAYDTRARGGSPLWSMWRVVASRPAAASNVAARSDGMAGRSQLSETCLSGKEVLESWLIAPGSNARIAK